MKQNLSAVVFVLVLRKEFLEVALFNDEGLHTPLASVRALRGCGGKSALVLLLVLFENRAEDLIVDVLALHSVYHGFQVQGQLELALYDLHESAL